MDLFMMNCELLATCSALGYLEGDIYHKEPDCLESVKDLIRYLRHEDDTRDIRQQLGAGQILQNDLLPIITQHTQDKPLFDACIRLMVNLTQPALLCFGKVPDDPAFRHHFLQVTSYLQAYKEAFADEKIFTVLSETLYNLLQLDWEQRAEEDNLLIERILLLVRNVLHVPADPYEEKNVDDDASIHDKLLWAIHMSGLDDLLKFLACAQSEQQWSFHILEIISLMFRDQTSELLVNAGQMRSAQEKQKDMQELELLRQKELAEKRSRTLLRGARHSRFRGSYVIQGLKAIGEKDVIFHQGLHNFKNYSHDVGKPTRRVPKRKQMAQDSENQRRSALNVRLFLREFCIDFLENCYNRLMMHLALKAYQELLLTVNEMDRSKDVNIQHSSNVIKSNIFYLMEFREIFLTLLRKYDERMQPRSFLRDLVESTHLFLKMLERFCKGRNSLVVQVRTETEERKSKHSQKTLQTEPTPEDLEQTWQIVSQELRLSESLTQSAVPFDATSETPVDEQRTEALGRIQDCIMSCAGPEALSLLRAARAVWPEGDTFGSVEVEPEEELELLKQILFTKLPSKLTVHILLYLILFANPSVVRPYIILLRSYSQNSVHTNHCITRMLHRLAVDLKMEALLYQLSIFSMFNKILEDPAVAVYQELVTFAKYVLNRFFVFATKNNKAFVELLFWKNVGAVREMTEGYNKDGEGKKKSKWTPEEEEQLQRLYEEYKDSGVPDIVETILPLLSISHTRREVVSHMVSMGLVDSVKDLKKERKGTRIVLWTEEQEDELQVLFEEFRDSDDVLGNILKRITAKRSRARIVDKILSMGLVSDRRDLYKKRKPSAPGRSSGMTEEEFFDLTGEPREKELEIEEEEEDKSDQDEDEQDYEELVDNSAKEGQKSMSRDNSLKKIHSLRNMVQTLQQQGLSGPVLWLQNSLNRTADDREEDGVSHPVALVPLTEENEDAMENKAFQKLLRAVGIRAPTDGQESFWRISSSLSVHQLRSVAASLDMVEETAAEGDSEGNQENSLTVEMEDNDNQEMRAQALRALLLSRQRKCASSKSKGKYSTYLVMPMLIILLEAKHWSDRIEEKISKKRRRVLDDDDDDDQRGNEQ
uniref:Timeless circadian clock n=1 Tax=Cyprinus carpio carpio TaxID=630221 RepID=A0A9J7Z155_CYPCA